LDTLRDAGPESAGHVKALVDASDEELDNLSSTFRKGGDDATDAMAEAFNLENTGIPESIAGLAGGMSDSLSESIRDANFDDVGFNITEGLAGGIEDGTPQAEKSSENLANKTIEQAESTLGVQSPSTVFKSIGINVTEGLVLGRSEERRVGKEGRAGRVEKQ